jgi:ribonuclease-3
MSSPQDLAKLERLENIIGYHPQMPQAQYLFEALQVAGSGHNRIGGRPVSDGGKRLAIGGDAAMALALTRPWYEQDDTLGSFMKTLWVEYF